MEDDTGKTEARGQGGLPGNGLTNHLGRNARRALQKYATTLWRETQPPREAFDCIASLCIVTIFAPLPCGIALYVTGALGAALPLEYGFAHPDPHSSEPRLHPIERTEYAFCCCDESDMHKEGAP